MTEHRPSDCIVVVGGGASASLLLHCLAATGTHRPVVVVDPVERIGPGIAYGTADPLHQMNVCRIRLSADGDRGSHLTGWLADHGIPTGDDHYLPRHVYGDYLADVARQAKSVVAVSHRRARVEGIRRDDAGWNVTLDDGGSIRAADVVLATGFPKRTSPPFTVPTGDPRVILDPWSVGARSHRPTRRVVIAGTGLTMVDVALSLRAAHPDVEVVAVSRRGLLPRTSEPGLPAAIDPDLLPRPGVGATDLVRHVIRLGRSEPSWQAVVDNLRPRCNDLWRAMDLRDQRRLLGRWWPWWNVHRHRTAPEVGRALDDMLASGALRIERARVEVVNPRGGRLRVRLGPRSIEADRMIDATGPADRLDLACQPALADLVASGHLSADPHGLGVVVGRAGRAIGRTGTPTPGLWTIGALRRGTEWETTAIPEIRSQAEAIADRLADESFSDEPAAVSVGRC